MAGGLFDLKNKTMKTLKITPGKATLFIGNRVLEIQGEDGKPIVGWMGFDASDRGTRQNRANATLFCEAFNVANETGLTPRQLLEQRDHFAKLCEAALPELTETLAEVGHDLSVGNDSTRLIMIIDDITEALDGLKNQDK